MRGFFKTSLWAAAMLLPGALSAATYTQIAFGAIPGWEGDDLEPALQVFRESCTKMRGTETIFVRDWDKVCTLARSGPGPARAFFEQNFTPVKISTGSPALFTGYFEPELSGARGRTDIFRYPLYRLPPEVQAGVAWNTRAEIENGLLDGRGLELVWLDNPVDAFFVHIQGSARIRLEDGDTMRVGFAGRNGNRYRSVGRELARRGVLRGDQISMQGIRSWALANPEAAVAALQHNPSFIFFQELDIPDELGPIGALQVPLTPLRSIAVDADYIPLGAPVWVRMNAGAASISRLMVAQDTGSAVNGAQRADIYYGTGRAAGEQAGQIKYSGELITLVPNAAATRLKGH